jgi:host factor-I protein
MANNSNSANSNSSYSTSKDINLQDVFLNHVRKEHIPVTIYITNGFQFKGLVKGFDSYTVILDTENKQNLIYKHAISTISPLKAISVLDAFRNDKPYAGNGSAGGDSLNENESQQ